MKLKTILNSIGGLGLSMFVVVSMSSWTAPHSPVAPDVVVEEASVAATDITGVWKDNEYGGTIEITKSGDVCEGVVIAHEKKQKMVGQKTLKDLRYDKKEGLWKGKIYDPNKKKSYNIEVKPKGTNELELTVTVGFFWKTMVWEKV